MPRTRGLAPPRVPRWDAIERLEDELARGAHGARLVPSARAGITAALAALGVRPGAEVIVSAFNYGPLIARVAAAGFVPIAVDVADGGLAPSEDGVAASCTPRTEAVLATYAFGRPAPNYRAVARRHGLALVIDAAQACGSPALDRGDASVLSFGPTKPLPAWGGGAVLAEASVLARVPRRVSRAPSLLRMGRAAAVELAARYGGWGARRSSIDGAADALEEGVALHRRPWHDAAVSPWLAEAILGRLPDVPRAVASRRAAHRSMVAGLEGAWPDAEDGIGFGVVARVRDARATSRAWRRRGIDAPSCELRNVGGAACVRAARLEQTILRVPLHADTTEAEVRAMLAAIRRDTEPSHHAGAARGEIEPRHGCFSSMHTKPSSSSVELDSRVHHGPPCGRGSELLSDARSSRAGSGGRFAG